MNPRIKSIEVDGVIYENSPFTLTPDKNRDSLIVIRFVDDASGKEWVSKPLTWQEFENVVLSIRKQNV